MWWTVLFLVFVVVTAITANYAAVRMIQRQVKNLSRKRWYLGFHGCAIFVAICLQFSVIFSGYVSEWSMIASILAVAIALSVPLFIFCFTNLSAIWNMVLAIATVSLILGTRSALIFFVAVLFCRSVSYLNGIKKKEG